MQQIVKNREKFLVQILDLSEVFIFSRLLSRFCGFTSEPVWLTSCFTSLILLKVSITKDLRFALKTKNLSTEIIKMIFNVLRTRLQNGSFMV